MIRKLNLQDDIESPCYSAADVIASLRRHRWVISSEEQDAHELYQILMSTVEEELYAEPSICSLFDIKQLMNEEDIHRTFSPFQGLFTNKLSCQICSHKNPLHFDSFNSLSLALPSPSLHPINLYGCLQNFIKAEYVKDIDCKQCSRRLSTKSVKSTFVKQLTFGKVPDCLCIHIQRTIWSNSGVPIKRNDHVNFKQYLCINQFINFNYNSDRNGVILLKNVDLLKENSQPSIECKSSNCCFDEGKKTNCKKFRNCQKCLHELVAVVVHIGDVYSGHYITYRKGLKEAVHSNQSWFMTSDTLVKKVSFSEVLAANAYMLIYERSSQICDNKHHVINSLV